jgi:hypothetical protein
VKVRAIRQRQEIDSARRDVFAHLARRDHEPHPLELLVKLGVDEMHLPQVRLRGISRDARPVLDRRAKVSVARHTKAGDELNAGLYRFAERVRVAARDRHHHSV